MPSCEQLPALLARFGCGLNDDVASSNRLLDLLGHDIVRCNVPDIMHIPVKTDEVFEHTISIYRLRIYTQDPWSR